MKIAHADFCWSEGLRELGFDVRPLSKDSSCTLQQALAEFELEHGLPDLVIIEFLGIYPWKLAELEGLVSYPIPIVVYAADSTINIYYYKYLLRYFDYVFVDQRSSVQALGQVKAHWLPLCVPSRFFREPRAKQLGITFVGLTTLDRLKRTYILAALHDSFPNKKDFQIFQGINYEEMQDILASSKATLNENLFNGLTWRVFQALASGTLLLTEAQADGVDEFFEDKKHLLCYTADTLIPLSKDILKHPEKYANIAKNGHEICKKHHSSKARVQELLRHILNTNNFSYEKYIADLPALPKLKKNSFYYNKAKEKINTGQLQNEMLLNFASCAYYSLRLVKSSHQAVMENLKQLVQHGDNEFLQSKALHLLAKFAACACNYDRAESHLLHGLGVLSRLEVCTTDERQAKHKLEADLACSLTILYTLQKKYTLALNTKKIAIAAVQKVSACEIIEIFPSAGRNITSLDKLESSIFFSMAQVYVGIGNIIKLGYSQDKKAIPEGALFLGLKAWRTHYHSKILDFILQYLLEFGVAGQALPELIKALTEKKATKQQAEQIQAIAKENFFDIL